jgi:hypothetical protein
MWATSVILKSAQSKQSPIGRKYAQSGHPGSRRSSCRPISRTSSFESLVCKSTNAGFLNETKVQFRN